MASPLPGLELVCLGTPTATVAGGAAKDLLWRRNLGLLIYLALSPQYTRTREHLLGLLWPEKPQDKAAHSLNEALRRCRAALGAGRIITERGRVTLDPSGMVVDVWTVEHVERQTAVDVLELIRGEFLEGFYIDNAPAFEDWVTAERTRLRELSVALLVDVGTHGLVRGDQDQAREHARRALTLQPHAETAAALAMKAAALAGDSTAALSLYHEFAADLESQLGEQPGRDLVELARRVRTGEWCQRSGKYRDREPPLVGRSDLHRSLFDTTRETAQRQARLAAISGDPGTGRSRLLREYVERLSLNGWYRTAVQLLETDHDAPWSTLRAIMRAGLADAPGMAAADPQVMAILAAVVPELADRVAPIESHDHRQVADALAAFVVAIAEEQPLVIAIDDAQWADGTTLDALRHVWQTATDHPITLALAIGSDTAVPVHLASLLERAGRDFPAHTARLNPFSPAEVEELVGAMAPWSESDADPDRLARRVTLESGGNPLLAVTLLRGLDEVTDLKEDLLGWPPPGSTYEAPLPFVIPTVVKVAVIARLSRLSAGATAVARASSTCGLSIDPELNGHLTDLAPRQLDSALDELERERLVAYTGERYVFNGRIVAEVIRSECVSRGERQRLRQRAVEFLGSRDDLESRTLRAELLMAEAQHEEALDSALGVVEAAIQAGALRTAQRALATAEGAAPHAESEQRNRIDEYRKKLVG